MKGLTKIALHDIRKRRMRTGKVELKPIPLVLILKILKKIR